jgi:hypothetical protein
MTDIELLQNCIKELGLIDIPVGLLEKLGIPIYNVRQRLIALLNKVNKQVGGEDTKPSNENSELMEEHNEEASDSDSAIPGDG